MLGGPFLAQPRLDVPRRLLKSLGSRYRLYNFVYKFTPRRTPFRVISGAQDAR